MSNPIHTPGWHDAAGRLLPALLRWAECQMPGWLRGKLDPADLVQQALLGANPPAGLDEDRLLAYLRRALSNDLIDAARKFAHSQADVPLDAPGASSSPRPLDWLADDATSPSERAARAELRARIDAALVSLPDAQRRAVEMRYLRQCKLQEIADALGRKEGAVAQLLRRGLAALKHVLREPGE